MIRRAEAALAREIAKRMVRDRNLQVRRWIALGRLVEDAGLLQIVGEDLPLLFGGLLWLCETARSAGPGGPEVWRRRFADRRGEGAVASPAADAAPET